MRAPFAKPAASGVVIEVYEKNGRVWQRYFDRKGIPFAEVRSRVQIVNDPKIEAFVNFVRQPAVSKGLQRCKSDHSRVFVEPDTPLDPLRARIRLGRRVEE